MEYAQSPRVVGILDFMMGKYTSLPNMEAEVTLWWEIIEE